MEDIDNGQFVWTKGHCGNCGGELLQVGTSDGHKQDIEQCQSCLTIWRVLPSGSKQPIRQTYTIHVCPECGSGPYPDETYACLHYADGDRETVPPGTTIVAFPRSPEQRPTRTVAPIPVQVRR